MISVKTFNKAIIFAVKKHRNQKRKGDGRPYILHPMAVLLTIYEFKESKNMLLLGCASLLHDVVEDCGVSLKTIFKKFGPEVASLVKELTLDKEKYETIGKTKYLCQEVLAMSNYALALKLADRYNNICDTKKMTKEFIKKYAAETKEILKAVKTRKLTDTHLALIKVLETKLKEVKKLAK
jgi:(p)ppGpp synthase/HD superfamily hydrolase